MTETQRVPWDEPQWLNPPVSARVDGPDLLVAAVGGSDFWQRTSYGFRRHSGHALLVGMPVRTAVEVTFVLDYVEQYDQAGVMVHVDETSWVKAGVEVTLGQPHLGAVVTREWSDWSLQAVPEWFGRTVTVRASRMTDSLVIRARADSDPWRLLRLAPMPAHAPVTAGPYLCAPERAGLEVRFTRFVRGEADRGLYEPPAG